MSNVVLRRLLRALLDPTPPLFSSAHRYVGDIVVSVNPFKNVGCVGKSIRNRCARV